MRIITVFFVDKIIITNRTLQLPNYHHTRDHNVVLHWQWISLWKTLARKEAKTVSFLIYWLRCSFNPQNDNSYVIKVHKIIESPFRWKCLLIAGWSTKLRKSVNFQVELPLIDGSKLADSWCHYLPFFRQKKRPSLFVAHPKYYLLFLFNIF